MKKKVMLSGGLKDMVTYCTAIYEVDKDVDTEYLTNIISKSPIFENKSFYTNVLGTVQRTTISRNTDLFVKDNIITLQIRYDILKVVDIKLTEKDEGWIKNDVESLLKHFDLLVTLFDEGKDE
jgi:hypothetical protein